MKLDDFVEITIEMKTIVQKPLMIKIFGMTLPGIELLSPGPLSNTLLIRPGYREINLIHSTSHEFVIDFHE